MNIWLITVGEPLPTDALGDRLLRAGIIANILVEKGHRVVWWTSSFDHVRKRQRSNSDTFLEVNERYRIVLLHSVAYKKNVSLSRIINHYGLARKFKTLSERETPPDVVLCSLPTLELSRAAVEYGKRNGVPVIIDIRDLWPDIFIELVPGWARGIARFALSPMYKTVRTACTSATSIIGITPDFVEWGINYAGRKKSDLDIDFPMGYRETAPEVEAVKEAENFWKGHGIYRDNKRFIACFFGNMGRQFDLETVIEAAKELDDKYPLLFVLCGSGDNLEYYKNLAGNCKNVLFPGWVGAAEIWTLMRMSSVGLAPYVNVENFNKNLPNKPIEYLSAGLPIVSSLDGILKNLLYSYNCGVSYQNGQPDSLASFLIKLYNQQDLLQKMSENAYSLYKEKYVAEKVYKNMIGYLEHVSGLYK